MPADGVILFDKPAGITSHDVVASVRRGFERGVKVGHAGTLDPFATGLLLVLVGRATRVQRWLMALRKTYLASARFGFVSSTGDPEGEIVSTGVVPAGDLELPVGLVRQRPPAYSAVKVGGKRAYALARAGVEVSLAEREVSVYRFAELSRSEDLERRSFEIECSSGTYVRSLIAELGDAYCESLRRTAIGPFEVDDADPERIVPLLDALSFLPEVRLRGEDARRAAHGVAVDVAVEADVTGVADVAVAADVAGVADVSVAAGVAGVADVAVDADGGGAPTVRLTDDAGLIALAEPAGGTLLKPVVGFRG